jgi:hypothetical protein
MDYLYTISDQAAYVINIPMLKGHERAGMTLFAKNNFGSQTQVDASHLHNGLVAPTNYPDVTRGTYGLYRVQVDLMGHSMLGKKNLVFLMDALWATDFELDIPLKWQMPPFNNSFMSSVFASLDPVAIESVGYDFLRAEFTANRVPAAATYVQMPAVDDYLGRAGSSTTRITPARRSGAWALTSAGTIRRPCSIRGIWHRAEPASNWSEPVRRSAWIRSAARRSWRAATPALRRPRPAWRR